MSNSSLRVRSEDIRSFALKNVGMGLAQLIATSFGITRQAANLHLQKLVTEGALIAEGHTRNRIYRLATHDKQTLTYELTENCTEELVWRKDISAILSHLPRNVFSIWEYGFTEMFNNAIDHSGGSLISVHIWKTAIDTQIAIQDDGVGIFAKIKAALNLEDERHAILELSKGKLTTDRKNHSGEGIFFTSRMVDQFDILSGGVWFSHKFEKPHDWVIDHTLTEGTMVYLKVANHTSRTVRKVLDQFSINDQFGFSKTIVPVALAQYENDQLISRSQAKRMLARVELFAQAYLDFSRVESIGKPFADQIFRVFQNEHPDMILFSINANADVQAVINDVLSQRRIEEKDSARIERARRPSNLS